MKIDIIDPLTIQIKSPTQMVAIGGDVWYGAPSDDEWYEIGAWAFKNDIVCNRGRGTRVIFAHEQDVLAFVLRWS